MASIKELEIFLTEQTIRELVIAIENAKKINEKTSIIKVKSEYSSIKFTIALETIPQTQESLGYEFAGTV